METWDSFRHCDVSLARAQPTSVQFCRQCEIMIIVQACGGMNHLICIINDTYNVQEFWSCNTITRVHVPIRVWLIIFFIWWPFVQSLGRRFYHLISYACLILFANLHVFYSTGCVFFYLFINWRIFHAEGDLLTRLSAMGYKLNYQQDYCDSRRCRALQLCNNDLKRTITMPHSSVLWLFMFLVISFFWIFGE